LGAPQDERLAVKPIRGFGDDTQVLYHTNSLAWYKDSFNLPPPSKLFYGPKGTVLETPNRLRLWSAASSIDVRRA